MTKKDSIFKKIDRGIISSMITVIEDAIKHKTKIIISNSDGEILKISPAKAKKLLQEYHQNNQDLK